VIAKGEFDPGGRWNANHPAARAVTIHDTQNMLCRDIMLSLVAYFLSTVSMALLTNASTCRDKREPSDFKPDHV
jgi:hypothetical protein